MSEFAANDFAAIASALRNIKGEPEPEYCVTCENGGWVQVYSPSPPAFDVCPHCFNPEGWPSP